MPRRKKNVLPKEELKFIESPKFIYHKSNIPFVHLSSNPVTLAAIPVDAISKRWVTPCFTGDQTAPLNSKGRKPRQGHECFTISKFHSDISTSRFDSTSFIMPADVVSRKLFQKLKPIAFRGLNNILSDVEDVKGDDDDDDDDDDDECLVEGSNNEGDIRAITKCVRTLTGKCEESKDELHKKAKRCIIPNKERVVNTIDSDNNSINDGDDVQEELTFNSYICDIKTPEISFQNDDGDNIGLDYEPSSTEISIVDHAEKKLSLFDVKTTLHSADDSTSSPNTADQSNSTFLHRRRSHEVTGTPRQPRLPRRLSDTLFQSSSSRSPASHMLPSLTRDPLPVFISVHSINDYSAGSENCFRSKFFDRVDIARETANHVSNNRTDRIFAVQDSFLVSDPDVSILKHHNATRSKKLKPSTEPRAVTAMTPDSNNKSHVGILADDTPESEHGLTYRMKQVKNRPKIFELIAKAPGKIPTCQFPTTNIQIYRNEDRFKLQLRGNVGHQLILKHYFKRIIIIQLPSNSFQYQPVIDSRAIIIGTKTNSKDANFL